MSVNREHICWQRRNGTWAIGFWAFSTTGEDFEWDVNYYDNEFWWFSEGHSSAEAALDAYRRQNANPGHLTSQPWDPKQEKAIANYEEIAEKFKTRPAPFPAATAGRARAASALHTKARRRGSAEGRRGRRSDEQGREDRGGGEGAVRA